MSGFICPDCKEKKLTIIVSLEIDSQEDDESSVQLSECSSCNLHALGYYTESRRGGGGESFHHYAYRISEERFNELLARLKSCKSRKNKHCKCHAHSWLTSSFNLRDHVEPEEDFFALRFKPLVLYDPNDPNDPNHQAYIKSIAKYEQDTEEPSWWSKLLNKLFGGEDQS